MNGRPHLATLVETGPVGGTNAEIQVRTAFHQILQDIISDDELFEMPAGNALERLLTYDRRLPLSYGLDMLSDLECRLVSLIDDHRFYGERPEVDSDTCVVTVAYNDLGRLHLRPEGTSMPSYEPYAQTIPFGYIAVPWFLVRRAEADIAPALEQEASLRRQVDALLNRIDQKGELQTLLDQVDDHVRHVESVCFYVDDELWSVIERCHCLIDGGTLDALRKTPLAQWTSAQRLGVAGLRALFLSGRSIRFEEFNGRVMTARRLFGRLTELGTSYNCELPRGEAADLFELAKAVGDAAARAVGQPWFRYRWNNGITLVKTERLAQTPSEAETSRAIPESMIALYESWVGQYDHSLGYRRVFDELAGAALSGSVDHLVKLGPDNPAHSPLEYLIQELLQALLVPTRADYSMSSSLRRPGKLVVQDPAQRLERVLALKPADFFTCIVAAPGISQRFSGNVQIHIYEAVQNRMEFNRWHFIAGNFPGPDVPRSRHFYYPPITPDLTEWSDQRHRAHTRAGVRYCVRAPGPDINEQPLMIAGHPYRGFYDSRIVRLEGPAFTVQDLIATRHYQLFVGAIWRRIIAEVEKTPDSVEIKGFHKGHGYEVPSF